MKILMLVLFTVLLLSAKAELPKEKSLYLTEIKELIISTQKTRGGTYNFLNGSDFAQFGVYEERSKIKSQLRVLHDKSKTAVPNMNGEINTLKKQLRSTNKMAFQLEPITAFKAYSLLIDKMLKIGQNAQKLFYSKDDEFVKRASHLMMYTILPLTDSLGKLRGLGSGVIAKSECEEEETKLMHKYINEIEAYIKIFDKDLNTLKKEYPSFYSEALISRYKEYVSKVKTYTNFAKIKIIDKSNIDEDPNKYFDKGTALINKTLHFFEVNKQLLNG